MALGKVECEIHTRDRAFGKRGPFVEHIVFPHAGLHGIGIELCDKIHLIGCLYATEISTHGIPLAGTGRCNHHSCILDRGCRYAGTDDDGAEFLICGKIILRHTGAFRHGELRLDIILHLGLIISCMTLLAANFHTVVDDVAR